jgi:predicted HD phosphohydrolase
MQDLQKIAGFTRMEDSTREECQLIERGLESFADALPDRVLAHLHLLDGSFGGMKVDRLVHSLQTATRPQRDGRDEEYVACALLHDIGDLLAIHNHADLATVILKPFVSERNLWMVQKHAIFQGYYYWHHLDEDRNTREKYRDHPHFDYTAEFSALYDQCSFDPAFDTQPLEHFEPLVRRVLAGPKWNEFQD